VFTNASDNLVSNAITGTGNVVMSASPTLTGTITAAAITASGNIVGNGNWTLGNADTDTITVGASFVNGSVLRSAKTATNTLNLAAYDVDGAAYTNLITLTASNTPTLTLTSTGVGTINNMSVGATTASTGAFTTLSASGVTTVAAGTVAAPAITTTGDTNTGIFFPAADTIAFAEGGVESMRIDSSGNVGVGTTSPAYKFVVSDGTTTMAFAPLSGLGFFGTVTDHPIVFATNSIERMRVDTAGNLSFNSGYGSVATAYGCRAWVNFDGTGTPSIRASGNVSSITDNGTGNYTVNFTTALPDANYSAVTTARSSNDSTGGSMILAAQYLSSTKTASAIQVITKIVGGQTDSSEVNVAIFR
jgi:hypothetical protein